MKPIYILFVTFFCIVGAINDESKHTDESKCIAAPRKLTKWKSMIDPTCFEALQRQIVKEMNAALTYLSMGVKFAEDKMHRPGFSEFFFKAANEEREHAIKIIEYLLMRNELINVPGAIAAEDKKFENGMEALERAFELETEVTEKILGIIKICEQEKFNDYHLVDYLTTDFLDEQYKGQRDLAGKIETLEKMNRMHGKLGEFLFDKKLLNGEV